MREYRHRHWRVIRGSEFSFNIDRLPYHVQRKSRLFGIWLTVNNPEWIGALSFLSNADAVAWINKREPRSIIESLEPIEMKPIGWDDEQYASGAYGTTKQMWAIARLQARASQVQS